jgi:hypothetical protein
MENSRSPYTMHGAHCLFAGKTVVDFWSIAGFVGTVLFGVVSWHQSIERREQRRALRVHTQAMYNNLWRMGASSVALLRCDDLNEAKHIATGIDEVSQGARNWVISFGKEYAEFAPYYEPAWEAKELSPRSPPFWRRIFF